VLLEWQAVISEEFCFAYETIEPNEDFEPFQEKEGLVNI
jgi:hypothetical protein